MILGTDTVTVLRGRSRDNWGDLQGSDTATVVHGCSVQPVSSTESTSHGELIIDNLTLFAPYRTDITATDRVQVGTTVYEVNGTPSAWRDDLDLGGSYLQAQLILREGNA